MLHAQGVMDLLLELNIRVDFVRHGKWLGERLRECAWFNKFDGLPTATSVVLNEIFGRQRLHGLYGAERRLFDGRANS
jgi:hypothetical protein